MTNKTPAPVYDYRAAMLSPLAERVTARSEILAAAPVMMENGAAALVQFADVYLDILGISYEVQTHCDTFALIVKDYEKTLQEVDVDLAYDINAALSPFFNDDVLSLLDAAAFFEKDGKKAKAHCYREVSRLAALYSLFDAVESDNELSALLGALFRRQDPATLSPAVAERVADALSAVSKVVDISLLYAEDMTEDGLNRAISNWAIDVQLFRSMSDDFVSAFSLHVSCGVWLSYFNQVWIFESDGVVDANAGSFEFCQTPVFALTVGRFLGPDADDLRNS